MAQVSRMQVSTRWVQKMKFEASVEGHTFSMDAKSPLGDGSAATPKHLLMAAVIGCSAMDVISLMKKYKQAVETFEIDGETEPTGTHPMIFKEIRLTYRLTGAVEAEKALEAVTLSQTQYCGVSAMVSKAVPIVYSVEVNGQKVGEGRAHFD